MPPDLYQILCFTIIGTAVLGTIAFYSAGLPFAERTFTIAQVLISIWLVLIVLFVIALLLMVAGIIFNWF